MEYLPEQANSYELVNGHWYEMVCTDFHSLRLDILSYFSSHSLVGIRKYNPYIYKRLIVLMYVPPLYSSRRAWVWAAAGIADRFHPGRLCLGLFACWRERLINSSQNIGCFRLKGKTHVSFYLIKAQRHLHVKNY